MPHITEHAPKVSTRLVYTCARESLRKRIQQDRQTARQIDTHTHTDGLSKTIFLDVLKVVHPKVRSYLKLDFLHDANTSIDMELKWLEETVMGQGSIDLLQARFFVCPSLDFGVKIQQNEYGQDN